MAGLYCDSFDFYATADLSARGWTTSSGTWQRVDSEVTASAVRSGAAGVRFTHTNQTNQSRPISRAVSASGSTAIVGFGFRTSNVANLYTASGVPLAWTTNQDGYSRNALVAIFDTSDIQSWLGLNTDGTLSAHTGSPSTDYVLGTTANALSTGAWYYIEYKVLLHASAGTVDVYVNGESWLSLTGKDTTGTANTTWTAVGIGHLMALDTLSITWDYDDLYICDGSGGVNDDVVGDCRVTGIIASSGDGSNTDWTPSTGVNHGAMVDEAPADGDTTYVSSASVGAVDTFNFITVGYTGPVEFVQVSMSAKKTDAGARTVALVARPASTNYTHTTNHAIGTGYQYWSSVWDVNPEDDGAWDASDVDGAEFGVEVTA